MLKNLIVLPGGKEISAGVVSADAIMSCTYTQCVNDGTELKPGSACSNELELKLYAKSGTLALSAGEDITYYKVADDGTRTKIGIFRCEKPTVVGTNTYKVIAYDRVSLLDKDLSSWLSGLSGWPYALSTFARMVCAQCGLSLIVPSNLPNSSYEIKKITGDGITGRTLMQWLGEIACRFIRATEDGKITFAWYSDSGKTINANGDLRYFGNGLSYEDYQTAKIEKVQLKVAGSELGTVYPDGSTEEKNTYIVSGNYLLTAETGDELPPVAQAIFEQLQGITYTPCQVSIQATLEVNAGDIVHIVDKSGNKITAYIMTKVNSGQRDTLTCSGSYSRSSTTAANNLSVKDVNGKLLEVQQSIDGLRVANSDMAGNLTEIGVTIDGLTTEVQDSLDRLTKVELSAGEVDVTVKRAANGWCFEINSSGDLIEYSVDSSAEFSINDDGELICEYEGDAPELELDDNGILWNTVDDDNIAILRTVINANGEWSSVYTIKGVEVSSLRFDFAEGVFKFNGTVEATAGDIGGCKIEDGILTVGGWNTGTVTIPGVGATEGYEGEAIWSQTYRDASTYEERAIALTPKKLYLYGRDDLGGAVCESVSWEDIINVVRSNS